MTARTESEERLLTETVNRHAQQIARLEASQEHAATKADVAMVQTDIERLRADMEKLKSDLTWRIVIAMSIMTAIFAAIVRLTPPAA